jgi:putative membrane protein
MKWWCSASTAAWDWTWRPYVGIWLFVLLVAACYVRLRRGATARGERVNGRHTVAFAVGTAALWASLDWPLGALGAGYLVSAHTIQYLLLTFVATPLLLLSVSADTWRRLARAPQVGMLLRTATAPLAGFATYNTLLVLTHIPAISDPLMARQLGNMAIDLAWFAGGLALWWPIVAPEGVGRMQPPVKMGYLFACTIIPTAPAAFLTFADYPLFSVFELAPRVNDIEALKDQQTAGIIMKLAADPFVWAAMAVIFFRWSAEADREEAERRAMLSRRPASTRG